MTRDEAKKLMVRVVTERQGLKLLDLLTEILDDDFVTYEQRRSLMTQEEYHLPDLISELVSEGELVEVEYSLKNLPYRAKSFLLPKETQVLVLPANSNLEQIPATIILGKDKRR